MYKPRVYKWKFISLTCESCGKGVLFVNEIQTFINSIVLFFFFFKSQLRNRLIAELQETALHGGLTGHDKSAVAENLCELAANSLVADHLKRCKYEYSLSVFLPESGLQESKVKTLNLF